MGQATRQVRNAELKEQEEAEMNLLKRNYKYKHFIVILIWFIYS